MHAPRLTIRRDRGASVRYNYARDPSNRPRHAPTHVAVRSGALSPCDVRMFDLCKPPSVIIREDGGRLVANAYPGRLDTG